MLILLDTKETGMFTEKLNKNKKEDNETNYKINNYFISEWGNKLISK